MNTAKHHTFPVSLPGNEANPAKSGFATNKTSRHRLVSVILALTLLCSASAMAQLSGTYTIDPSSPASKTNYKDFQSVYTDLDSGVRHDGASANGAGVKGPVVFRIADGSYENLTMLYLLPFAGSSATNTVTFTSISGDSSKVQLGNNFFVLKEVNNLIFSHLGCKNQSIILGVTTNVTVTHCLFRTTPSGIGIIAYDNPGARKTDINHNNFQGGGNSITLVWCTDIRITDNIISTAPASAGVNTANSLFFSGSEDTNVVVKNNIFLRSVDTAFRITATTGAYISNNKVRAYCGLYIQSSNYTPVDTIANNSFYTSRYGIYSYYSDNLAILNNNIYTDSAGSGALKSGYGACIWLHNLIYHNNVVLNNNMVAGHYRADFYFVTKTEVSALDYNNYIYADSIGHFGSGYAGFAAFKSALGLETHGLSVDPKYDFNNYLKTTNATLAGRGKPLASVKYDIDGKMRHTYGATIGAYELTVPDSVVWPGDANNDYKADINDFLSIGLAYNDTGAKRTNASTSWTAQKCTDWTKSFKDGTNHKNADCNGNGIIDSSDIGAIALNYSQTHSKAPLAASGNPTDPPLTVKFSKDSVQAGDTVNAVISLGSSAINAQNIYGVTMSIGYGSFMLYPKNIVSDFSKSWLGTLHSNMISLVVNDTINKIIHIGLSRTDQTNASGKGQIGTLSIYMPDNVAGKREVKQLFKFIILEYKAVNAGEDTVLLNPVSDSIPVYQYKTGISGKTHTRDIISIFPNPAGENIHLISGTGAFRQLRVTDAMGKEFYNQKISGQADISLPLDKFPAGVYFVSGETNNGFFISRFVKK